jgi:hypothetical protein
MQARQFLNVVMQRYGRGGLYTATRIKPDEQLFYRSTEEALAAKISAPSHSTVVLPSSTVVPPWMETMSRMPSHRLRFERSILDDKRLDFLPFCEGGTGGDSKILCMDAAGHTVLYDIDAGSLQPIPCLSSPKGSSPIGISIANPDMPARQRGDAFYVMGRFPTSRNPCNFEALKYIDPSSSGKLKGWQWHQLPMLPAHVDFSIVKCHTLLEVDGDPVIVVSSPKQNGVGTYCFNTVSCKWFKAGSWTLPFFSRAEQIPELGNLWFGITSDAPNHFCAMDLSSVSSDRAPSLQHSWQDLDLPNDWVMLDCSFVYLGAGRFCITKVFEFGIDEETGYPAEMGAVISGVEVVHKKRLQMVKHKSKFYNFIRDDIVCVF